MIKTVQVRSPAKVNLFLEVLHKREDGYHELETLFQEINLCDEISVEQIPENQIKVSSNSPDVPTDSTNLVYRAALLFFKQTGISSGIHIHILKKIPVAAGLGGGSSNAAATLKALQSLFQVDLGLETNLVMARQLGADVPFFLKGGSALGRGIGDRLESLKSSKKFFLVLVNPNFKVATANVYRQISLNLTRPNSDITLIKDALARGDISELGSRLFNRLEDVVFHKFPALNSMKEALKKSGALGALLSGSGPTLFAITEKSEEAIRIQKQIDFLQPVRFWTAVCQTVC